MSLCLFLGLVMEVADQKPENIELGRRLKNLESAPKVTFDTAKNFFRRLNKKKGNLETWVGELYLELHRGTLTTHGLVKKQNRKG